MANQNANEISEQLFQAIDAIVSERIRVLEFDKTVVATIIDNSQALYGKYKVTTDDNITFNAYAEITTYPLKEKVYVRIPGNDYTKQKIITGRYIQTDRTTFVPEVSSASIDSLRKALKLYEQTIDQYEKKDQKVLQLVFDKILLACHSIFS